MPRARDLARRPRVVTLVKIITGVVVLGFITAFVVQNRDGLAAVARTARPGWLLAAVVLALLAMAGTALTNRQVFLATAGPLPLPVVARMTFISQLGKYVPGSVWPVVALAAMCRGHGIAAATGAATGVVALVISLASGTVVGVAGLTAAGAASRQWWWLPVVVLPALGLVHPAVLRRLTTRALRIVRRDPPPMSGRYLLAATGSQCLVWVVLGLHCWAVGCAVGLPPASSLLPVAGGFAFAYTVGTVAILTPAGVGVREGVLAAALIGAGVAADADVLALIVLGSRVILVGVDLVLAGSARCYGETRHRATPPSRS